ncbi:hypothetical protein F5Y13DRAFT_165341 [Hypoxylon sp. FL1857]|nr:hypothetical protein F5Y13DRAFT_165341 [Hypoxylon sp. FL1857]
MRRQSTSSAGRRRSLEATAADDALAKMGYKAELPRSLSMLSVLGLSFAIVCDILILFFLFLFLLHSS